MSFSNRASYVFTSESVAEGHPDKVCDQISDAVLDAHLAVNPEARVACETLATTNTIVIAGETRGAENITKADIEKIARDKVREIGYLQEGFHADNLDVYVHLHPQSAHIAMGVDSAENKDEGAGDQGIMFGFACTETKSLMPAPIDLSHKILQNLARVRHSGEAKGLGPDAKSQVSLLYENGKPVKTTSIVVSTQHAEGMTQKEVRELVRPYVLAALPDKKWMCDESEFYVNPTGQFVIGGPDGDCGLTGRKIIVDTYGGAAPHGGGAFSGKDPTKVDRSAAYMARYLAKNVVAAGLADRCTIQLSYAIGVSKPISFYVNTDGTAVVDEAKIEQFLQANVNMTPRAIREQLKLNAPIYARTAAYGHFGREPDKNGGFTWEKTDLVEMLQAEFKQAQKKTA
ncbi:MAG: methionine adenosyltransferase [Alphaproteobacteria bacterium]|nr:methionine adenosyltransferase [Alphaproteobacteria bacterium]